MSEVLYKAVYDNGINSYVVEKEVAPQEISVVTYEIYKEHRIDNSRIWYNNIGEEYTSPFLSWYNLLFCSNNYGPAPDYEYMHRAVQEGKKTAATVYLDSYSPEGKDLVSKLPFCCGAIPYGDGMLFVYRKGRLSDFFDIERIHSIYYRHGVIDIDWNIVRDFFAKDISFFGDEKACGFNLQSGGFKEQFVVNGLLLGYPIESTIAFLMGTTHVVLSTERNKIRRRLRQES